MNIEEENKRAEELAEQLVKLLNRVFYAALAEEWLDFIVNGDPELN